MINKIANRESLIEHLNGRAEVKLELGCGNIKRFPDSIGIDLLVTDAVDIVGDAIEVLTLFPDSSVDSVHSNHFLEHVGNPDKLLFEVARILKHGGTANFVVPHFSNPFFYSDPTHLHCFGIYTFAYYTEAKCFRRTVPSYARVDGLTLMSVDLSFKSYRPNYIRYAIKKCLEKIVNLNFWTKEFYEELLCWILPCYEISVSITKTTNSHPLKA